MMSWISKNKEILLLFFIAFLSRLILVFTACGIANDGCSYVWLAKEIAVGNFDKVFSSILPPLFPILIAGTSYIFQDFELSGRLISCIFGSLTVFPLFFLIKEIFDRKIAIITVLFFIVHPYLLQASGMVLTEALFYFLTTSIACISWIAIQKRRQSLFLIVGVLLSFAFLTRFEGIFWTPLVLGWIWFAKLQDITTRIRWRLVSSFFCITIFILASLPYSFFVSKGTEKFQICSRQQHYETTFFEPTSSTSTPFQKTLTILKSKLFYSVPRIPFFIAKAYYVAFLPFLFFGLLGRKKFNKFRIGEAYILSFILVRLLVLLVFAGINERFLFAFIPMALCWAGVGFWEINYYLQEKFRNKTFYIGEVLISHFSVVILVIILIICLTKGMLPIRQHRAVQKEVGYWLKENTKQKEFIVISQSPQEAFYAEAKWYDLECGTYNEIINYAKEKDATYIIIDKNINQICPDFKKFVKADDMEILTTQFQESNREIIIYKLKK